MKAPQAELVKSDEDVYRFGSVGPQPIRGKMNLFVEHTMFRTPKEPQKSENGYNTARCHPDMVMTMFIRPLMELAGSKRYMLDRKSVV